MSDLTTLLRRWAELCPAECGMTETMGPFGPRFDFGDGLGLVYPGDFDRDEPSLLLGAVVYRAAARGWRTEHGTKHGLASGLVFDPEARRSGASLRVPEIVLYHDDPADPAAVLYSVALALLGSYLDAVEAFAEGQPDE